MSPLLSLRMDSDAILEAGDENVRKSLLRLLNPEQTRFRSPSDINRILNDPSSVFSFKKFLNRAEALIRSWVMTALGTPLLYDVYFEVDDDEKVQRLQHSRKRLGDHVVDPLPEVVKAASKAKRGRKMTPVEESDDSDDEEKKRTPKRRGRMLDKKKSAKRLDFDGSGDEDEEIEDPENLDNRPALRSPDEQMRMYNHGKESPLKKKARKSQEKTYEGRRVWNEAEVNAIKEGIEIYGNGKWAEIKDHFHVVLKDRTSGQIKV